MFDARSILDILLGGGGPRRQGRPTDSTVFKDLLDQLGAQPQSPTAGRTPNAEVTPQQPPAPEPTGSPQGQQSFEDLLRNILNQFQQGQQQAPTGDGGRPVPPPQGPTEVPTGGGGPEVGRELQDLLRQILEGRQPGARISRIASEGGQAGGGRAGEAEWAGGLAEALRQLLGQATAGVREGASRIDEATGLADKARDALGQATGQSPDELIGTIRRLIEENKLASGAALGGLGALVLGTRSGRSLAGAAVKLGGLALIGGLAYKAYQNYQDGKPPLATEKDAKATPQSLLPAPEGTGFEARAVTHDAARRYIRAMIAAAAADGRIDHDEQQRILGGLRQSGLDDAAQQFLAAEITSPATVAELASGIASPEEALQVYTAARMAVDPDHAEEHAFLSALAEGLGIDDALIAQVDATTRGAAGSLAE
jgi:uncharacterized membrane protein YebE (DUF533 family)